MKSFETAQVLKGVDLTIPRGSVTGLRGKNGSGKSPLLKFLLGLLKPSSGKVKILGEEPWHLSVEAKAQLGYVAQEVSLYSWMRVRQIIEYTAAFYPTWNDDLPSNSRDAGGFPRKIALGQCLKVSNRSWHSVMSPNC
ncbi:MAG: ATP-binding cassette domain-containing protein [Planctomycetales bacterium]